MGALTAPKLDQAASQELRGLLLGVMEGTDRLDRGTDAQRIEVFERCCAIEQVLADAAAHLARDATDDRIRQVRRWQEHLVDAAALCFGFRSPASRTLAASRILRTAEELLGDAAGLQQQLEQSRFMPANVALTTHAAPAECLTSWPVDLLAYARFVRTTCDKLPSGAARVIGIRTSGSYLGPVWAGALREKNSDVSFTTVRPSANQPLTDFDAAQLDGALNARAPARMFVVDDGVETGGTMEALHRDLHARGIAARSIVHAVNQEIRAAGLPAKRRAWWSGTANIVSAASCVPTWPSGAAAADFFASALPLASGALASLRIAEVRAATPSYWQRYLAAHVRLPLETVVGFDFRRRKQRWHIDAELDGSPRTVVAKYVGFGMFAQAALARYRAFSRFGPRALGVTGGFLFYEWVAGQPLRFGGGLPGDVDLEVVASYLASTTRVDAIRAVDPRELRSQAAVSWNRLQERYSHLPPLSFRATARDAHGVLVQAPRNQGHWHYIRTAEGGLARTHLDVSDWPRICEVSEEIAAVVFELGLGPESFRALLTHYVALSHDETIANRLTLTLPIYLARVQRDFDEYDRAVSRVPDRYRHADTVSLLPYEERRRQIEKVLTAYASGELALQ